MRLRRFAKVARRHALAFVLSYPDVRPLPVRDVGAPAGVRR
jgi:hypothetical protein